MGGRERERERERARVRERARERSRARARERERARERARESEREVVVEGLGVRGEMLLLRGCGLGCRVQGSARESVWFCVVMSRGFY